MKIKLLFIVFIIINLTLIGQKNIIDETVAIVGDEIILKSEIETQYLQYLSQGITGVKNLKCQLLEEMLFQKLLLSQAKKDSIEITEAMVESELDRRLRYFIQQMNNSVEQLEKYFDKSIVEIKEDFRDEIKKQMLIQQMQQKVTENVKITPDEVKLFFNKLPADSIPDIEAEFEFAHIVQKPEISEESKQLALKKIKDLRKRVIDGEDFSSLAIMYSEDPGSAQNSGELGFVERGEFVPEFEAVAFKLKKGEISEIFETEYGFHFMKLIERRGEKVNVKHILIKPKITPQQLEEAYNNLEKIAQKITADTISFAKAAHKYSHDEDSKNNEGLVVNANRGTSKFTAKEMDASAYFTLEKMRVGEISKPVLMKTPDGSKAYRIIKLISKTQPHKASLKTDYNRIKEVVLNQKKETVISEWINEKRKETFIKINSSYLNKCTFKHKWVDNQ